MESQQAKPAKPAKKDEKISNVRGIRSAFLVILACAVVAVCVFMFVMGDAANFEGNDPVNGHPINLHRHQAYLRSNILR